MILIIALLMGVIIFLLLYVFVLTGKDDTVTVQDRVQSLETKEKTSADLALQVDAELSKPLGERIIKPFFISLRDVLLRITPSSLARLAEDKVSALGGFGKWGVQGFIVIWATSSATFALSGAVFATFFLQAPTGKVMLYFLMGFLLGFYIPLGWSSQKIKIRRQKIRKSLPDVLDLLCVSVQAGLSFDGALSRVVEKLQGPFTSECHRMQQEMRMGMPRRQALTRLAQRCQVQEVTLFTAAIIQADQLGVGIAKVLTIQAENMRERRHQYIKEAAQKAPVKLIFPLAIFIFPALFIVVLAPAILNLIKNLPK